MRQSDRVRAIDGAGGLPFAGVELGGTKCVCTLALGPDAILDQRTVATTLPDETLPAIAAVLADWATSPGFAALGIASFGPIGLRRGRPGFGRILATNKPGWRDVAVLDMLSRNVAAPVGFDTDVNGAALAERRWGAGRGLDDFAYVTVGTGVGVGLIVGGRPTRGIGHSEIGHLRVPRLAGDTAPSTCRYHADCVEGLASGEAIAARLGARSFDTLSEDDALWPPVVAALAAMCHALVCAAGPMRIAMGGGVIARNPHLPVRIEAALIESLAGYMDLPSAPYIGVPELGVQAGPLGAIALAEAALAGETLA